MTEKQRFTFIVQVWLLCLFGTLIGWAVLS